MLDEHPLSPDGSEGSGFAALNLYPRRAMLWRSLAISDGFFALFAAASWASYFSGDPHNTFYTVSAPLAAFALFKVFVALRGFVNRAPVATIDRAGLHLFHPNRLFWAWVRIKGARVVGSTVIVDLQEFAGIDQGVWNRTEVDLKAPRLDADTTEVAAAIACGVATFGLV